MKTALCFSLFTSFAQWSINGKISSNQGQAKHPMKDRCERVRAGVIVVRMKGVDTTSQELILLGRFI